MKDLYYPLETALIKRLTWMCGHRRAAGFDGVPDLDTLEDQLRPIIDQVCNHFIEEILQ